MGIFTKQRPTAAKWIQKAEQLPVTIQISDPEVLLQLKMIDLQEKDLRLIHVFQEVVSENIHLLVDSFYQSILGVPELTDIIQSNTTVERLTSTLNQHIIELFNGRIDNEFLAKRMNVSKSHYRIGLQPKWYLSAFQNVQNLLISLVYANCDTQEDQRALILAMTKILNFEQQLVLEAYEKENAYMRERQNEEVKQEVKQTILSISEELVALSEETDASVKMIVSNSRQVNQLVVNNNEKSRHSQSLAEEGQHRMRKLTEKIHSISQNTNNVEKNISALNDSLKQITEFVGLVQGIADQTNLLSLNSAIEAARAGEHGRGFAVVADEVRKLADQTKKSITEIYSIVNTSNIYMEEVVKSIHQVQSVVQIGEEESDLTQSSFNEIVTSMEESVVGVGEVEEQIKGLIAVIDEIGTATSRVTKQAESLNDTASSL
ncbi:globin-coupled sensor protein [Peribacillus alkalitolerans]|uniref:globin-coupled sensor protein n=1 Tax=Peribacillus alkalitolerans TaxID=1550385 RepID=UPI001F08210F|nr:globin-coupled sensor protein [Peribacillus alkalitolerans]